MSRHVCFNGDIIPNERALLNIDNRSFSYGDGFFETIRCVNSKPIFFKQHFQRIQKSLLTLKMQLSMECTEQYFVLAIYRLLQKNRIYKGARIRITFFRSSGGLYTPTLNKAEFIINAQTLDQEKFILPPKGLNIDIYPELKPISSLSALKSNSSLFYVLAGMWKKESNLDDCLILNQNGRIIEGLSSNIFIVNDSVLYATTTDCGCVDGTMRRNIIDLAKRNGVEVKLVQGVTEKDILAADEVWFTNAIQGISYISGYKERRYYHALATKFVDFLNQELHGTLIG